MRPYLTAHRYADSQWNVYIQPTRPWFLNRVSFINTLLPTPRFDSSVLYFGAETTSILVGSKAGRRGDLAIRPRARTSGCGVFARSRESNVRIASSVSFFQSLTM